MKTISLLLILFCGINLNTVSQNLKKKHIIWGGETEKYFLFENRKVYSFTNDKFTFLYKMSKSATTDLSELLNEIEDLEYELHTNNEVFVEDPDNSEAKKREKELKEEIAKKKEKYNKENIPITEKAFLQIEKLKSINPDKYKTGNVLLQYFDGRKRYVYKWDNSRKKGNLQLLKLYQFYDFMNQFI